MATKETPKKATGTTTHQAENSSEQHTPPSEGQHANETVPTTGQKRQHSPSASSSKSKAIKTSSSPALKTTDTSTETIENEDTDTSKIISFLLSPAALELCLNSTSLPKIAHENTDSDASSGRKDYFSSNLTPLDHLICAVVLSRPISHNLGHRTIATILNEPWSWDTAQKILDAGRENAEGKTERVEAMEDARTQHRQKTASELGGMAQVVVDEGWDEDGDGGLKGLLEAVAGDGMAGKIRELVKGKVKGLGNTGMDIFLRRVQGCQGWEGIGWFVDDKTTDALVKIGLPDNVEELKTLVGEKREDFVVVLERALGIVLEGKQDEMKV